MKILIIGTKLQGKDTFAELLEQEIAKLTHHKVGRFALADHIKMFFTKCLGLPANKFYDQDLKEVRCTDLKMTPRYAMQQFGTECVKPLLGRDVWCQALLRRSAGIQYAIVTDVRFKEEYDFFTARCQTRCVFIRRDWEAPKPGFISWLKNKLNIGVEHSSEKGLYHLFDPRYDVWVENTCSVEQLREKAAKVANDIVNGVNYNNPDWI